MSLSRRSHAVEPEPQLTGGKTNPVLCAFGLASIARIIEASSAVIATDTLIQLCDALSAGTFEPRTKSAKMTMRPR
jgi:hypothetical protein